MHTIWRHHRSHLHNRKTSISLKRKKIIKKKKRHSSVFWKAFQINRKYFLCHMHFKDLSLKVHTTIQPVFVSWKIEQELNVKETKPPIVNQQCVVYGFQCDLRDAGYVGYTRRHLHNRVKGHKQQSSAIAKHYKNMHGTMPQGLLKCFKVLKKCRNKFDCLVYKMLFIRALKPNLNVQSDSIHAKVIYNLRTLLC